MKNTYFIMILLCLVMLPLMTALGCETTEKAEPQDTETKELKIVTDPDGVIMTISGMPVTKQEFENYVVEMAPDSKIGLFKAFQMHFLLQTTMNKHYSKELKELSEEINVIEEKIKSGEMTFIEAVLEYSDDPGKDVSEGLLEGYSPGLAFYTLDQALAKLKLGEVSEPFLSPIGWMIVKLEKEERDLDGELVLLDLRQVVLTLDRFLPDGESSYEKIQELAMESEIEILDDSLLKEVPDLQFIGMEADEMEKKKKEIEDMETPEINWRDLDPETVVLIMNDYEIKSGELKTIADAGMPTKREIYSTVIYQRLLRSLSMIGHFKDDLDDITKKLDDIKADIESGKMTFEEAQEEFSTDPGKAEKYVYENTGRRQFVPEFESIMFDIPIGDISEVFFTEYGGHMLTVDSATTDDDGERETVDVRHILIGFDQYVDQDDPNAMYSLRMKVSKEIDIVVFDKYLQSVLPGLGHENDAREEAEAKAKADAEAAELDAEETEEIQEAEKTEEIEDK